MFALVVFECSEVEGVNAVVDNECRGRGEFEFESPEQAALSYRYRTMIFHKNPWCRRWPNRAVRNGYQLRCLSVSNVFGRVSQALFLQELTGV